MPQATLIRTPPIETAGWFAHCSPQFGIGNRGGNRDCNSLGDLVLHRENIGKITVVALGPYVIAGVRLDKLGRYPDAVPGFTQTAFEDIADAEFTPDLFNIDRPTLVGEAGIPSDHE